MPETPELGRIREEAEAKQRGVVWPDMTRQSRSIDGFLWNGDRKAKPIQRAALVLYTVMFLSLTALLVFMAWKFSDDLSSRVICIVMACLTGIFGVRFARNIFLH